jgi:hypothetical protein
MIEVVDRVFTFLTYPKELSRLSTTAMRKWNRLKLHSGMMKTVRMRQREE